MKVITAIGLAAAAVIAVFAAIKKVLKNKNS